MDNENRCVMCGDLISEGRMVCYKCEYIEPSFDTIKTTVLLTKISDVKEFISLSSKCRDDVVVKSGNFAVDAKSIMGLVSLDLTKPLRVEFYGFIPFEVREGMRKFIVN